jgi:hypothetical protein
MSNEAATSWHIHVFKMGTGRAWWFHNRDMEVAGVSLTWTVTCGPIKRETKGNNR